MTQPAVLVVDDRPAKRYAMARTLTAAGFEVTEADNGCDAIEQARGCGAVVLDVHLPDLHGFEVCREIKKASPTTAVIHVSAVYVETSHRAAANMAGADAYLVDPQPQELLDALKVVLRDRTTLPRVA